MRNRCAKNLDCATARTGLSVLPLDSSGVTARPAHDSEDRDLQEIRTPLARLPCGHAVPCTSDVRDRYTFLGNVLCFPQPGYREIGGSASLFPKSAGDVLNTEVASAVEMLLCASAARRAVPCHAWFLWETSAPAFQYSCVLMLYVEVYWVRGSALLPRLVRAQPAAVMCCCTAFCADGEDMLFLSLRSVSETNKERRRVL